MPSIDEKSRFPVFTKRFKQLRGQMSQAQFAEYAGISRATVSFYENGSRIPDALALHNIAKNCGVSADWLLGLVDNREPENVDIGNEYHFSDNAVAKLKLIHKINDNGIFAKQYRPNFLNDLIECDDFDSVCFLYWNLKRDFERLKANVSTPPSENCFNTKMFIRVLSYSLQNSNMENSGECTILSNPESFEYSLQYLRNRISEMILSMLHTTQEDFSILRNHAFQKDREELTNFLHLGLTEDEVLSKLIDFTTQCIEERRKRVAEHNEADE